MIVTIERKKFTLFYDYDRKKIQKLSDLGKKEWFKKRMEMVFLNPLSKIFDQKNNELNNSETFFLIGAFSMLLNGIEALGSFMTSSQSNHERFKIYIEDYLKNWSSYEYDLWNYFRNGIAHSFTIEKGGIQYLSGNLTHTKRNGLLKIDPKKFFEDFKKGLALYFLDINKNNTNVGRNFMKRFNSVYH